STTALVATILFTGLAWQAQAAEPKWHEDSQGYVPVGDIGMTYKGQCWVATAAGFSTYYGYWASSPKATPGPHKYGSPPASIVVGRWRAAPPARFVGGFRRWAPRQDSNLRPPRS